MLSYSFGEIFNLHSQQNYLSTEFFLDIFEIILYRTTVCSKSFFQLLSWPAFKHYKTQTIFIHVLVITL